MAFAVYLVVHAQEEGHRGVKIPQDWHAEMLDGGAADDKVVRGRSGRNARLRLVAVAVEDAGFPGRELRAEDSGKRRMAGFDGLKDRVPGLHREVAGAGEVPPFRDNFRSPVMIVNVPV